MKTRADAPRITLLVTGPDAPTRRWIDSGTRFIDLKNLAILQHALHSLELFDSDVERVVIDHAATSEEALGFLAGVPTDFAGDILFLGRGGSYVSASAHGEGRVLRAITPLDLQSYLETHRIIAPPSSPRETGRPADTTGQPDKRAEVR